MKPSEKTYRRFHRFEDAEQEDRRYFASLSPGERLEMAFQILRSRYDVDAQRLEKVCRITQLKRC
jgi:hypothetical protein